MPIFVDFKHYFIKKGDEYVSFCPEDRRLTRFFKCRAILFARVVFLPVLPVLPRQFSQCSTCNQAFTTRRINLERLTGISLLLSGILLTLAAGYMIWVDATQGKKSYGMGTSIVTLSFASLALRAGWRKAKETLLMKHPSLHAQLLYGSLVAESRFKDDASIRKYLSDCGIPKGEIAALLLDKTKISI
jgi:hypothetical protein